MINRRTFLTQAGLLSAGVVAMPNLLSAKPITDLGLQLYSLRDQLPKDVKGVIAKIAAAGYKKVETYGYSKQAGFWGLDAKAFSDLLKANGLTTPSGHYDFADVLNGNTAKLESYIEAAKITGQTHVIVPYLDRVFIETVDDCNGTADKITKAAELCKKNGLKLGYHNHNFEWREVGGTTFYDILLENTDPKLVDMELDLYWVVRSGKDPLDFFAKHPGRFAFVHVKDMDKTNKGLNTEIGKGSIDYVKILAGAQKAGVKHFIVEQENYINIDPYVSIAESAKYLKTKV